mmetsp:Transcript_48515/g.138665  ORF Transcript_48515/g.138665 Transcript_48515/m.138665 type:complete len:234 (+) Transcript_48515:204-905(+)
MPTASRQVDKKRRGKTCQGKVCYGHSLSMNVAGESWSSLPSLILIQPLSGPAPDARSQKTSRPRRTSSRTTEPAAKRCGPSMLAESAPSSPRILHSGACAPAPRLPRNSAASAPARSAACARRLGSSPAASKKASQHEKQYQPEPSSPRRPCDALEHMPACCVSEQPEHSHTPRVGSSSDAGRVGAPGPSWRPCAGAPVPGPSEAPASTTRLPEGRPLQATQPCPGPAPDKRA